MVTREGKESVAVPESVKESAGRTLANLEILGANLSDFLQIAEPDVLAQLSPLQRAQALLQAAKATTVIFALKLRCSGIQPDDHPVKSELERICLYEEKLQKLNDWSKAPLRPSAAINYQAATRFIEHSLPDLTPGQKQSMRKISRGEVNRSALHENRGGHKKRKCQSWDQKSVRAAAQDFLEKAQRELLGSNTDLKGPLRNGSSDEEDQSML